MYPANTSSAHPHKKKESWGSFLGFVTILLLVRSLVISPFRIPSGSMIPTLKVGDFIITAKFPYGWSRYSFFLGGHFNYFSGRIMHKKMPSRGDIVVFTPPYDTHTDYIKRAIGLPGDTVQMIDGILHVNGKKVIMTMINQNYTDWDGKNPIKGQLYKVTVPCDKKPITYRVMKQQPFGQAYLDNTPPVKVPEDHIFFMGDNWDGSADSREIDRLGVVHKDYLLGPALFIFFSINHEGVSMFKPWTWLKIPFGIRFSRCIYKGLN